MMGTATSETGQPPLQLPRQQGRPLWADGIGDDHLVGDDEDEEDEVADGRQQRTVKLLNFLGTTSAPFRSWAAATASAAQQRSATAASHAAPPVAHAECPDNRADAIVAWQMRQQRRQEQQQQQQVLSAVTTAAQARISKHLEQYLEKIAARFPALVDRPVYADVEDFARRSLAVYKYCNRGPARDVDLTCPEQRELWKRSMAAMNKVGNFAHDQHAGAPQVILDIVIKNFLESVDVVFDTYTEKGLPRDSDAAP